jgi:hypothetical protein
MARVAATDLVLTFTQSATSKPNSTEIGLIITNYYAQAFRARGKAYSTDTDTIIDSLDVWHILVSEISDYVNGLGYAIRKPDSDTKPPKLKLSTEAYNEISSIVAGTNGYVNNVRVWNEDVVDY